MTGRVVSIGGREPVARSNTGGFLGLRWRYEGPRNGGCPHLIGVNPDRPAAVICRLKIETLPRYATPAELAVGAQLWTDYEDGAAALMAASMEQEGQADA